ncbi:MAG: hypothetical protein M3Y49_20115 [Actinomycetota bacterium]|nr:hypothetical protein [Actinomycetota bacterium]
MGAPGPTGESRPQPSTAHLPVIQRRHATAHNAPNAHRRTDTIDAAADERAFAHDLDTGWPSPCALPQHELGGPDDDGHHKPTPAKDNISRPHLALNRVADRLFQDRAIARVRWRVPQLQCN